MNPLLFRERLEPLRNKCEVARMLGCTHQNVDNLERRAFAKIVRELHRWRAEQCFEAGVFPDEWWRRLTQRKVSDE